MVTANLNAGGKPHVNSGFHCHQAEPEAHWRALIVVRTPRAGFVPSCSPTLQQKTKRKIPLEKEFQCLEKPTNPSDKPFVPFFFTLLPCFAFWSVSLLGCHGNIIGDGFSVRTEKKKFFVKGNKAFGREIENLELFHMFESSRKLASKRNPNVKLSF